MPHPTLPHPTSPPPRRSPCSWSVESAVSVGWVAPPLSSSSQHRDSHHPEPTLITKNPTQPLWWRCHVWNQKPMCQHHNPTTTPMHPHPHHPHMGCAALGVVRARPRPRRRQARGPLDPRGALRHPRQSALTSSPARGRGIRHQADKNRKLHLILANRPRRYGVALGRSPLAASFAHSLLRSPLPRPDLALCDPFLHSDHPGGGSRSVAKHHGAEGARWAHNP